MLRVEAGMHTAKVNRMSVDSENHYLVTSSDDKTVRVWDLTTNRLVRIIRPPIREGDEGKLYAVAISPDGQTIATAGWTSYDWDGVNSIYLFSRETGQLIRRIQGLPNAILRLAYSPDGKFLATTMGNDYGIRLYETGNYTTVGEDRDYGKDTYGLDIDKAGHIVTASLDGFVRLYETDGGSALRLTTKKGFGKKWLKSAKFSPDGTKIAVGFVRGDSKVEVLSAKDLSSLYSAKISDIEGILSETVWSSDGKTLYAGGTYRVGTTTLVCAWEKSGKGEVHQIPVSHAQIRDFAALNDGRMVYGSADPIIGIINVEGKVGRYIASPIALYGRGQEEFLLSSDGSTIQFNYEEGSSPARFSIFNRKLELVPNQSLDKKSLEEQDLHPPITEADGISIIKGNTEFSTKLNGKLIPLENLEITRRVAIAPDKNRFLLGTMFYIRLFDKKGNELWKVTNPGIVQGVNISRDGELAVAAFGDGTIRWYRMTDGEELLVFFPHADKQRWVLWNKTGYYDASPGAEDLSGWHVNNGKDNAADFFPLSLLHSTFYRPDVIEKVLKTRDVSTALRLANEETGRKNTETNIARMLPPVVEIISSTRNASASGTKVTVRYRVRTLSGEPVTKISVLVNGKLVSTDTRIEPNQVAKVNEIRVAVPESGEVSIVAENKFFAGLPATLKVP